MISCGMILVSSLRVGVLKINPDGIGVDSIFRKEV